MRHMTGETAAESLLAPTASGGEELLLSNDTAPAPIAPQPVFEDEDEDAPRPRRFGWAGPALAILLSVGWIGAALWFTRGTWMAPTEPAALLPLIAAIATVPTLIGIVYLLLLRTSAAEAQRFGKTAR